MFIVATNTLASPVLINVTLKRRVNSVVETKKTTIVSNGRRCLPFGVTSLLLLCWTYKKKQNPLLSFSPSLYSGAVTLTLSRFRRLLLSASTSFTEINAGQTDSPPSTAPHAASWLQLSGRRNTNDSGTHAHEQRREARRSLTESLNVDSVFDGQ